MPNHTQIAESNRLSIETKGAATTPSSETSIQTDDELIHFKAGPWLYTAMATLCILTFIVALDATSLAVAVPVISKVLNGTGLEAFWAGTAFLLCSTVFQPPLGSLSSIFGRKSVMLIAVLLFLAGALICGLAHNFTTILVGRAVQGVGGGGIAVLTEIVVCDMIPLRLRGEWFGILSSMYAIGTVLGPIVGGAFAQHVTWRWIFWVNLPFIGIGLVMVPLFIKLQVLPTSFVQKLGRVDWIGIIIFIGSTTSFMMAISWGGVQYAWTSWHTLVPLVLGLAGWVIFYIYEERYPTDPIVRTIVFKNRNAAAAYISTVVHSLIVLSLVYYLPLYYEGVKGLSPTITGVAVFPETFTVAPAAVVAGIVITKIGVFRWAVWSGWAITCLGCGLLYLMDVQITTVQWIFLNLVPGIGTGFLYPALQFSVQAATKDEDMASAVAMYSFFRALGQAFGVVIGGTIFQNQLYAKLRSYPELASNALAYSKDASALAQIIRTMPEGVARTDIVQAYADALKVVWVVMCGLAGLGLFIGFLIKDYPLDRLLVSPQLAAAMKKSTTDAEEVAAVENKK